MVVNPGSRSAEEAGEALRQTADDEAFRSIDISHPDLSGAIDEATAEDRTVVAMGGDGTVNAVAQHLVGRGTLGVLPAGTLNHFARDLGIGDMDVGLEALRAGTSRTIDVGRLDGGRCFLNNAGFGLYPEMVYHRDKTDWPGGKWVAAAGAAARVLREGEPVAGTITADGDSRALLAWMVFIGNNRFGTTPGRVGQRDRLDEGVLDVGLFLAGPRGARRSSLAWRVFRSLPWQTSRRLIRREARRVEVRLHGEPRPVSWDGEVGDRAQGLDAEILPRAIEVLVPAD